MIISHAVSDNRYRGLVRQWDVEKSSSGETYCRCFGEIRRQLDDKAAVRGTTLQIVDRFFPSSKLCSQRGLINTELTLTDRAHVCQQCGMVEDRDLNAAENLNRAGLARIHACGHNGSVQVSVEKSVTKHG